MSLLVATAIPASADIIDGFEAASLDPFWTPYTQSGSYSLSRAQVHSGSQSLQFNSTSTANDKSIYVEHVFATPTYGAFSVWLYDTGADILSSNYLSFQVYANGTHSFASIGTQDYDLGTGQNGSNYYLNPFSDQVSTDTGVDRTSAWHHFLIDTTPTQATFQIDGATVYTGPGAAIDHVRLSMGGPNWRPAWTSYWDDFAYASAVPEPSTYLLGALGTVTLAVWRTFTRLRNLVPSIEA